MRIGHVVYLSSAGCSLWSWSERAFAESPVRTPVGADPVAVVEELARLEGAPVAVLVDMIDEEHVRDGVARLGRRDQQVLLERKLARRFPRTTFRAAQVQGRSAENPDEDRALLSALTRPEPVRILLERLVAARLPVAGVFSPALLACHLLDPASRGAAAAMLVLRRSNGRLQHTLFMDGALVGSRRLRGPADLLIEDAPLLLRQIDESLRYFDPSFEPGADTPLDLMLSPADRSLLAAGENRGEGWRLRTLDVAELARRLRVRAPLDANASERIFIELLRAHAGGANYLPASARGYFDHFRVRIAGKAACLALAGAALAGTAHNALHILDAGSRSERTTTMVERMGTVLAAGATMTDAGIDPLEMQQVVAAYDALDASRADPGRVLAAVAAAVSQRPHIRLDALEWSTAPAAAVGAVQDEEASGGEESPAAAEGADTADASGAPATGGIRVQIAGRVQPFDGDYPLAFDEVAALIDVLREDPAVVSVTPLVQPLDVSSASMLTGELARGTAPVAAAFRLQIVLRTRDEQA